MRSSTQFLGTSRSLPRAWIKGAGFTDEELERPLVLIANTIQDFSPENTHLRTLGEAVKAGVRMNGGTPLEFNTFHVTDSEAFGARSMKYVLPSRDLVAASIEMMVEGHGVDALVAVVGGDKPTPAAIMAAARLDIPFILVYCGPTPSGEYQGKRLFLVTVYDGVGEVARDKLSVDTLRMWEENLFPGPGAGDTLTSGNTAGIYGEALGLALPGTGTITAGSNQQIRAAKRAGMRIVDMIHENLSPSKILSPQAFENAIRVTLAVSGSTNAYLHFIAMAHEAGIQLDFDQFDKLSRTTPTLVKLAPSGPWGVTDFHRAGGVQSLLRALGQLIRTDCLTVTGKTIGANHEDSTDPAPPAEIAEMVPAVIQQIDKPLAPEGSLMVLKGTLAPAGSLLKISAAEAPSNRIVGPARVFEDEESAVAAIISGDIQSGTVVVIRNEGPRGGPGMREMLAATSAVIGMGLGNTVPLITDGRFSGASHGIAIGYVGPEAADAGPIGVVQDGDDIIIDLENRTLDLDVEGAELARRHRNSIKRELPPSRSYLNFYSQHVAPACEGAILNR